MREFPVIEFDNADHPTEGDTVPDFTRPLVHAEYWEDQSLSGLAHEQPVLLVFHPMDGDFPATYIWQEIAQRDWEGDIAVVGLSISSPYEHKQFIRERGFEERDKYALFSDPQNHVAEEYGIVHDLDGMNGVQEPRPAVFLLDTRLQVEYAWVASEWPEFPPYESVEQTIESLIDYR